MPSATSTGKTKPTASGDRVVRLTGHQNFRQRLVLSLLTRRPLLVSGIRSKSTSLGLRDYEAGFLRLLEKLTNGTRIEIGYTGTSFSFKPGTIAGGSVVHDCGTSREVGYYLEWIAVLAPFAKREISLTLKGITTGQHDLGVDLIRTVTLPILGMFLPQASSLASALELRITARGSSPHGGGSVYFRCPLLPNAASSGAGNSGGMLRTIDFTAPGRVKRIRGVASATRVSPQMANRMVEAARSVLNRYIPDLYLFADVYRGEEAGKSPGFALSLVSTTTSGAYHCAEAVSRPGDVPEDVALQAARSLLTEMATRGCIPRSHQPMVILLMALGPEDVGRVKAGRLTPQAVAMLRDVREFTGVTFQIKTEREERLIAQPGKHSRQDSYAEESENEEEEQESGPTREAESQKQVIEETLLSCIGSAVRGARKVG